MQLNVKVKSFGVTATSLLFGAGASVTGIANHCGR